MVDFTECIGVLEVNHGMGANLIIRLEAGLNLSKKVKVQHPLSNL
jgi:hypothetical protein